MNDSNIRKYLIGCNSDSGFPKCLRVQQARVGCMGPRNSESSQSERACNCNPISILGHAVKVTTTEGLQVIHAYGDQMTRVSPYADPWKHRPNLQNSVATEQAHLRCPRHASTKTEMSRIFVRTHHVILSPLCFRQTPPLPCVGRRPSHMSEAFLQGDRQGRQPHGLRYLT